MTTPKHPDNNGLAVASLILGILSVTAMGPLTGVPAVITGFMGLKNPVNKSYSIAGIIMGGISIILTILLVLFIILLIALGSFSEGQHNNAAPYDYSNPSGSGVRQRV